MQPKKRLGGREHDQEVALRLRLRGSSISSCAEVAAGFVGGGSADPGGGHPAGRECCRALHELDHQPDVFLAVLINREARAPATRHQRDTFAASPSSRCEIQKRPAMLQV
jgi:hypothetical protein